MHNQEITSGNTDDRRNKDRRVVESGPLLGGKERRISAEKRQPDVAESSFEEWEALMAQNFSSKPSSSQKEDFLADWDSFKHL